MKLLIAEMQRLGANMQLMSAEQILQRNLIIQIQDKLNTMDAAGMGKIIHSKENPFFK
jgi:hypothetical protein